MKGASDGGIYVPHNTKKFPGFSKDGDSEEYDAAVHRDRIFGVHVDKYMA
jgi:large subunit ribosomal protein L5e